MKFQATLGAILPKLVQIARGLCVRRSQPARWLFVVATIPLAILAVLGYEYQSSTMYAVLASICLMQAFRPTLLGWLLAMGVYAVAFLMYLGATLTAYSADVGGDLVFLLF